MIEARAVVSRIDGDRIWVRALGAETCPKCAAGQGCGGGVFAKLVGRKRPEIELQSRPGVSLRAGDGVIVGIDDGAVLSASLWAYLVPLLGMFIAGTFAHQVLEAHDALVAAFGIAGLLGGMAVTAVVSQRAVASGGYRLSLLRRDPQAGEICGRLSQL